MEKKFTCTFKNCVHSIYHWNILTVKFKLFYYVHLKIVFILSNNRNILTVKFKLFYHEHLKIVFIHSA